MTEEQGEMYFRFAYAVTVATTLNASRATGGFPKRHLPGMQFTGRSKPTGVPNYAR
jgi:hypothetical protein